MNLISCGVCGMTNNERIAKWAGWEVFEGSFISPEQQCAAYPALEKCPDYENSLEQLEEENKQLREWISWGKYSKR